MKFRLITALFAFLFSSAFAVDFEESVLVGLQGVGLEIRQLNIDSDQFELSESDVEEYMLSRLKDQHVRLLSDIELDVMPGQPFLEVSIVVAHAQGPSHIYSVELELREMAKLERPRKSEVTMAVATWERKMMGIANRPEAVLDTIERLMRYFSDELHEMNIEEGPVDF